MESPNRTPATPIVDSEAMGAALNRVGLWMISGKKDKSADRKVAAATDVELLPNAWEIFEKAVDRVAKSPPQHRSAEKKQKTPEEPKKS
jgi:hypothetical protein